MIITNIQQELKAPKGQRNSFGNYNYRSCEDILLAVKPLLKEYDAYITLSDELVQVGDRYYIKATATIKTKDEEYSTTAYAREAENKKGMDEAQITGSASSYARKYALNGLLAIDDTKDADATNDHKPKIKEKPRFLKEHFDKFESVKGEYKDGKAALEKIKSKYKIAKTFEDDVMKLYEEGETYGEHLQNIDNP